MLTAEQQEAIDAVAQHGSQRAAARALGIDGKSLRKRLARASKWLDAPSEITDAAKALGVSDLSTLGHFWKIGKDENGNGYSGFVKNPAAGNGGPTIVDLLRETFEELRDDQYPIYPQREVSTDGCLLVVDLSDVHVMKLCVQQETGATYDREIAVHRMVEGTRGLLSKASGLGIGRILVVLGNDILHVDNAKATTTSGTHQDTAGTIHQGYRDAVAGYIRVIEMCAEVANVDLIYVPSNHDWIMGWALANQVATWFRNHPHVNASSYNVSERHRKYYRFGTSLIGLTHGDGAKEADLGPLMTSEARGHVAECLHRYWYVHHLHHKIRKAQGVLSHNREKDHIGMTMVHGGVKTMEGDNIDIEYVRSPSPPDSWHDRNGYVNRQAVECFAHDPHDGQIARFTHWF